MNELVEEMTEKDETLAEVTVIRDQTDPEAEIWEVTGEQYLKLLTSGELPDGTGVDAIILYLENGMILRYSIVDRAVHDGKFGWSLEESEG